MYRALVVKKLWGGPLPLANTVLTAIPTSVRPMARATGEILSAIIRHTPVAIAEADRDNEGDWFRLESEDLWDHEVFNRLSNNWRAIAGRNATNFSLIHCLSGTDRGIWLYCRKAGTLGAYPHGCQRIISWS